MKLSKVPVSERAALLPTLKLYGGSHEPNGKACAMELTAWLAGEPWSDHPECTCPVIGALVRSWNDALPDSERTALLLPLLPKLIGTRGSSALASRRATMATDWLFRVNTPAWLRLAGLTTHADALASLPEITDFAKTPSPMPVLEAERKDAAAARAAARAAAVQKLEATKVELQQSTVALVERMCAATDLELAA